jgi:hypothetical protein
MKKAFKGGLFRVLHFPPVHDIILFVNYSYKCQCRTLLINALCVWKNRTLNVSLKLPFYSVQKLTKGKDSWSLAEVVHAIVLLAHFHSLSSFVFGCGVNEELDQDGGHHNGSSDSATPLGSSPRSVPSPPPTLTTAPSSRDGKWSCTVNYIFFEINHKLFFCVFLNIHHAAKCLK